MTSAAVERVVTRLSGVRAIAGGVMAKCPAHPDDKASLAISEGTDGRALLHCHAGCATDAILDKAGLQVADLFEDDAHGDRRIISEYDYPDAAGTLGYQVVRFLPKDFRQRRPDGAGGWHWNMQGVTPLPYRLPELLAADPDEIVFIPEGEKDVDRLRVAGFVATCNHGGAGKWKPELSAHLRGRRVVILPDNDEPGRDHARKVAASLKGFAREIRILDLPGVPEKGDVSDFLMAHGVEKFRELIASAKAAPVTTEPTFREIVTVEDLTEKLEKLYETGYDRGVSTGLSTLDDYYRVRLGEMTLVGGIPGHGKSGILGQFIVNLARRHKWIFGDS